MWSVLPPDWSSPLTTSQVDIDPVFNRNTICNWFRGRNFQTANCTAQKCFFMFFFVCFFSHRTRRLFICWQCEQLRTCYVQMPTCADSVPCSNHNLLLPNGWASVTVLVKVSHVGPANQIPPNIVPQCPCIQHHLYCNTEDFVHRGSFSFSFLYKSEKYYFQHLH